MLSKILIEFENLLKLKINFTKSKMVSLNFTNTEGIQFANILDCKVSSFPITYLGIPLYWHKLKNRDRKNLVNKVETKLEQWKGKNLSLEGRLTLIQSVLNVISIYWMVIFILSVHVRKKIDRIYRKFL
jgi:hypothetical protein